MNECYSSSDFDSLLGDLCGDDSESYCSSSNDSNNSIVAPIRDGGGRHKKSRRVVRRGNVTLKVQDGDREVDFEVHFSLNRAVYTDVRRSYPGMLLNCFNSAQPHMILGFMETFFLPNMARVGTKINKSNNRLYKVSSRRTMDEIMQHIKAVFKVAPDFSMTLQSSQLHTYSDCKESKMVCMLRVQSTSLFEDSQGQNLKEVLANTVSKVYMMSAEEAVKFERDLLCNQGNSNNTVQYDRPALLTSVSDLAAYDDGDVDVSSLVPRKVPLELIAEAKLVMFMDENKRIMRMEMSVGEE